MAPCDVGCEPPPPPPDDSLSDMLDEKHLGMEGRRRRFDPATKYGGRAGRTCLKGRKGAMQYTDGAQDVFLKVSRPLDKEGNVMVSALDVDFPDILGPDPKAKEELSGGRLFELEEHLEAACIRKINPRRGPNFADGVITKYILAGVGWVAPNEEERKRLEQRRNNRLTLVRLQEPSEGKWKVVCKFRDAPLESITEPSLLDHRAKLTTTNCGRADNARVFTEDPQAAFCPSPNELAESYLTVDLGSDCHVAVISTQGRFPPLRKQKQEELEGMRVVDDVDRNYQNWVTKYEVSTRANRGSEWVSRGEFKGNEDMTTEVAHRLQDEPCVRYVRFRVVAFHKTPAMRVGVYGVRPGAEEEEGKRPSEDPDQVITYEITQMKAGTNTRRVPNSALSMGCCAKKYCRCHKLPAVAVRRKRLKEGVVEEVRKLNAGPVHLPGAEDAIAEEYESDPEETTRPASSTFSPPPRGLPALSRQRSRSEGDLSSRAESSPLTADSSFLHVDLSRATTAAAEEDDWVVMDPVL